MDIYKKSFEYFLETKSHRFGYELLGFFAVLGFIPLEFFSPILLMYLNGQHTPVFFIVSLYLATYAYCITLAAFLVMRYLKVPDKIEHAWFSKLMQYRAGRFIMSLLRDNSHEKKRRFGYLLMYEAIYHSCLAFFGIIPFMSKFAEFRLALYPRWSGYTALVAGMVFRAYCIVFFGTDWLKQLYS